MLLEIVFIAVSLAVLVLVSLPIRSIKGTQKGLDPSYLTLSHLTFRKLRQGRDLVFTYGPWGFLSGPYLTNFRTGVYAYIATTATHLILLTIVYLVVLNQAGHVLAVLVAFIVGQIMLLLRPRQYLTTEAMAVIFLLVQSSVTAHSEEMAMSLLLAAISCWAFYGQVKYDVLFTMAPFVGLGYAAIIANILASPGDDIFFRLSLAVLLPPAVAAGIASLCWLSAGQRKGDVWPALRLAWQTSRHFAASLGRDTQPRYIKIAAILVLGTTTMLCAVEVVRNSPGESVLTALLSLALIINFALVAASVCLVMNNFGHMARLSPYLAIMAVSLANSPPLFFSEIVLLAGLFALVARKDTYELNREEPLRVRLNPVNGLVAAFKMCRLAWSPSARSVFLEHSRGQLRAAYDLPSDWLDRIRELTVDIVPVEQSMRSAYPEVQWAQPFPVYQLYHAYTPELDQLNCAHIESDKAPRYLILQLNFERFPEGIPPRFSPATMLKIFTAYSIVSRHKNFVLLERTDVAWEKADIASRPLTAVTSVDWSSWKHLADEANGFLSIQLTVHQGTFSALRLPVLEFHSESQTKRIRIPPTLLGSELLVYASDTLANSALISSRVDPRFNQLKLVTTNRSDEVVPGLTSVTLLIAVYSAAARVDLCKISTSKTEPRDDARPHG